MYFSSNMILCEALSDETNGNRPFSVSQNRDNMSFLQHVEKRPEVPAVLQCRHLLWPALKAAVQLSAGIFWRTEDNVYIFKSIPDFEVECMQDIISDYGQYPHVFFASALHLLGSS